MIAVDKDMSLTLTGNGDVISEPTDGVIGEPDVSFRAQCSVLIPMAASGIGSGGQFAVAAARALIDVPGMTASEIALKVRPRATRSAHLGLLTPACAIRP